MVAKITGVLVNPYGMIAGFRTQTKGMQYQTLEQLDGVECDILKVSHGKVTLKKQLIRTQEGEIYINRRTISGKTMLMNTNGSCVPVSNDMQTLKVLNGFFQIQFAHNGLMRICGLEELVEFNKYYKATNFKLNFKKKGVSVVDLNGHKIA